MKRQGGKEIEEKREKNLSKVKGIEAVKWQQEIKEGECVYLAGVGNARQSTG